MDIQYVAGFDLCYFILTPGDFMFVFCCCSCFIGFIFFCKALCNLVKKSDI